MANPVLTDKHFELQPEAAAGVAGGAPVSYTHLTLPTTERV